MRTNKQLIDQVVAWGLRRRHSYQKEELLRKLFKNVNSFDYETILNRCHALNGIYNVNNHWIDSTVEHLMKVTKSGKLKGKDSLKILKAVMVEQTYVKTKGKVTEGQIRSHLLSFTSKYLSFLFPKRFHLYDKKVRLALETFGFPQKKKDRELISKTSSPITAYRIYSKSIEDFLIKFDLSHYSYSDKNGFCYPTYKALDIFLWNLDEFLKSKGKKQIALKPI